MIYSDALYWCDAFIFTHPTIIVLSFLTPHTRKLTYPLLPDVSPLPHPIPTVSLFIFIFIFPSLSLRAGRDCPLSRLRWG